MGWPERLAPSPVAASQRAAPEATGPAVLGARGLSRHFGRVAALEGVDLDLAAGSVTALLGDNGAGKSTLIALLSGVLAPSAGEILIDGAPCRFADPAAARSAGVATVFQKLSLVDDRSIAENLFLGAEPLRFGCFIDRARMQREARSVLGRLHVNLPPVTTAVRALSGGQRQCVAVARTLLRGSRVVILDEPTAALGLRETRRVLDLIARLRDEGRAVLLVSHNMDNVFDVADRALVLRLGRKVADVALAAVSRADLVGLIVGGAA
ncbi:MAG TPA: ATP-binding cassette domain-containing protein [Novosphingobium sp.]|nr:ATP-binding cassette domain-containing protein [Novosphingobium sp.]HZV09271.1 ATP-binding cassette domain-containing protein [Novosphingobium sp.]